MMILNQNPRQMSESPFTNLELNIICVMKKRFAEFNKNGCVVAGYA